MKNADEQLTSIFSTALDCGTAMERAEYLARVGNGVPGLPLPESGLDGEREPGVIYKAPEAAA